MEKQKLENQGWTVDKVRERISGCQRNRREFKIVQKIHGSRIGF